MKNNKVVIIVSMLISILLIIMIAAFLIRSDKKPPAIEFSVNDTVYTAGGTDAALYEGVTAVDDRDGDVTNRVVIEKIVEEADSSRITVTYAVSDRSGNVAKASRVFPASFTAEAEDDADINNKETLETIPDMDAVNAEESSLDIEGVEQSTDEEAPSEDTGSDENGTDTKPVTLDDLSASDREKLKKEVRAEIETELAEQNRRAAEAAAREAEASERAQAAAAHNAQKPVITLRSSAITTPIGQAPAWVNVIGALTDDKDSYAQLFTTLKYTKYDMNEKGTYRVGLTVTDSDKNVSDPVYVSVTVK